jgi:hypothetical protein
VLIIAIGYLYVGRKFKDDRAVFRDLHKGVYIMSRILLKQTIYTLFILSLLAIQGTYIIKPNFKKIQSLILKRKYQTSLVDRSCEEMVGGKFQAAIIRLLLMR